MNKVKGYNLFNISKRSLKKKKLFSEIIDENKDIVNEIEKYLDSKSLIYAFKKKGIIKCVYIFEQVKEEKTKKLKFVKYISVKEVDEEMEKKLREQVVEELKEHVTLEEYSEIIFEDLTIEPVTLKIGKYNVPLALLIFSIGTLVWIITDDFLYYAIALCISISAGAVVKVKK